MSLWNGPNRWADGGPGIPDELCDALRAAQSKLGTIDQVGRVARRLEKEIGKISGVASEPSLLTGHTTGLLSTKTVVSIVGIAAIGSMLWWQYVSEPSGHQIPSDNGLRYAQPNVEYSPRVSSRQLPFRPAEKPQKKVYEPEKAQEIVTTQESKIHTSQEVSIEVPVLTKKHSKPKKLRNVLPQTKRAQQTKLDLQIKPDPEHELIILKRAQDRLSERPEVALGITQEHLYQYPSGIFAQEREMIAIEALFQLDRIDEGVLRAKRFLAQFGGSTHAPRVRSLIKKVRNSIEESPIN